MSSILVLGTILAVLFFVLLFFGVPIAISITISSFVTITCALGLDFGVFVSAQKMVTSINSFTLLAVPFFILAGLLMNSGGIAIRLIRFSQALVGRLPGSLAVTNVAGNAMFGSISGSGIAAAAAIGGVLGPIEKEEGYAEDFSAAVNVASAPVGQLIPPTAAFIIFSLASGGVSVSTLFIAGWIPGLLWALVVSLVALFIAKKRNYPVSKEKTSFKIIIKTFFDALPSLALLIIIIGGIISGAFTATEAAAVSVVYTLFLSLIVYRSISLKELKVILGEAAVLSASIMFLVGASGVMGFVMSFTGIPQALTALILGVSSNPIIILLLINVILLIIGTFMDMGPATLIFTPILMPVALATGMDPVQFGVMMVFNLALGTITPPVGTVLFVGSNVSNVGVERIIKEMIPFYFAILVVLLMVTFIPMLSLWLPNLLGMLN